LETPPLLESRIQQDHVELHELLTDANNTDDVTDDINNGITSSITELEPLSPPSELMPAPAHDATSSSLIGSGSSPLLIESTAPIETHRDASSASLGNTTGTALLAAPSNDLDKIMDMATSIAATPTTRILPETNVAELQELLTHANADDVNNKPGSNLAPTESLELSQDASRSGDGDGSSPRLLETTMPAETDASSLGHTTDAPVLVAPSKGMGNMTPSTAAIPPLLPPETNVEVEADLPNREHQISTSAEPNQVTQSDMAILKKAVQARLDADALDSSSESSSPVSDADLTLKSSPKPTNTKEKEETQVATSNFFSLVRAWRRPTRSRTSNLYSILGQYFQKTCAPFYHSRALSTFRDTIINSSALLTSSFSPQPPSWKVSSPVSTSTAATTVVGVVGLLYATWSGWGGLFHEVAVLTGPSFWNLEYPAFQQYE